MLLHEYIYRLQLYIYTAIGTKLPPAYANIFMDRLEQKLLSEVQIKPHLWFRYIDDIFMVWLGSESELEDFLSYINAAHEVYMELVKRMGELLGCESQ